MEVNPSDFQNEIVVVNPDSGQAPSISGTLEYQEEPAETGYYLVLNSVTNPADTDVTLQVVFKDLNVDDIYEGDEVTVADGQNVVLRVNDKGTEYTKLLVTVGKIGYEDAVFEYYLGGLVLNGPSDGGHGPK